MVLGRVAAEQGLHLRVPLEQDGVEPLGDHGFPALVLIMLIIGLEDLVVHVQWLAVQLVELCSGPLCAHNFVVNKSVHVMAWEPLSV